MSAIVQMVQFIVQLIFTIFPLSLILAIPFYTGPLVHMGRCQHMPH